MRGRETEEVRERKIERWLYEGYQIEMFTWKVFTSSKSKLFFSTRILFLLPLYNYLDLSSLHLLFSCITVLKADKLMIGPDAAFENPDPGALLTRLEAKATSI